MKLRGLIVAAVLLAALTGALYWSNRHPPADSSNPAPTSILALNPGKLSSVEIKKKGADPVVLTMDSKGQWAITAPVALDADAAVVANVIDALSFLNADRVVEDKGADLKTYGLDDPALEFDITEQDTKKTQKLLIGNDAPVGGGAYAAVAGDPRVFSVAMGVKSTLDKGLGDLRDKRLLRATADQMTKVELVAKKQDIVFEHDKDNWKIDKPPDVRTDQQKVGGLVTQLEGAAFDPAPPSDDPEMTAAFSAGMPVATVTVTTDSGAQQLEIRKNKDDYYAKSNLVPGAHKIQASLGQSLDKSVDDFRNNQIFDIGYQTPSKIEVHDNGKSYLLTRSGEDWMMDGKKMDVVSTLVLADKIRALPAAKNVTSGFANPTIDVAVTSNDGKVEMVSIAKNGANYVEKKDGETALYEVPAPAVLEVEQAAANLKPADANAPSAPAAPSN